MLQNIDLPSYLALLWWPQKLRDKSVSRGSLVNVYGTMFAFRTFVYVFRKDTPVYYRYLLLVTLVNGDEKTMKWLIDMEENNELMDVEQYYNSQSNRCYSVHNKLQ